MSIETGTQETVSVVTELNVVHTLRMTHTRSHTSTLFDIPNLALGVETTREKKMPKSRNQIYLAHTFGVTGKCVNTLLGKKTLHLGLIVLIKRTQIGGWRVPGTTLIVRLRITVKYTFNVSPFLLSDFVWISRPEKSHPQ